MQGKETKSKKEEAMSFEGFCACIRIDIQHRLGEDAEVTAGSALKNNGIRLYGITVKEKGSNIAPTIYLENYYERYIEGEDISALEREILFIYRREKPAECFDTDSIKDWQKVKKNIVFRLVNLEMNREKLEEIPYFTRLDLAVTFSVVVETEGLPCSGSFTIHNSHMEMWGITADELYVKAMENTRRLEKPEIISLEDALLETIGEDAALEEERAEPVMYVLTNEKRVHGASCLLFTDMLQKLADRTGSDLYILPSSIHEVILIPAEHIKAHGGQEGLDQMVNIVNAEQLQPEDILSDHAYRFIRETGEITM